MKVIFINIKVLLTSGIIVMVMEKVFHEKSSEEKIIPDPSGTNILRNTYTLSL
jgi:hypothetical protein